MSGARRIKPLLCDAPLVQLSWICVERLYLEVGGRSASYPSRVLICTCSSCQLESDRYVLR
jgi:hypothetical protein